MKKSVERLKTFSLQSEAEERGGHRSGRATRGWKRLAPLAATVGRTWHLCCGLVGPANAPPYALPTVGAPRTRPLPSSEHGAYKTVKARFWPWLSGDSLETRSRCSLLIIQRKGRRPDWASHAGIEKTNTRKGGWQEAPSLPSRCHANMYHIK